jgi:hypothetical protein
MAAQLSIRKIFSPDIMFNDSIKTCWTDNIETINRQIPLHKELKLHGIYSLNIKALNQKDYFVFCLPINKNWSNEDLSKWKQPILCFDIIGCHKFKLSVQLIDDQKVNLFKANIDISETEDWTKIQIPVEIKVVNARLISFSGPVSADNFLIKSIILKEK